jgi:hypothetical protein
LLTRLFVTPRLRMVPACSEMDGGSGLPSVAASHSKNFNCVTGSLSTAL